MPDKQRLRSWTEYALQGSLLLLAFAAPMSIAATQTAWGLALLFWLVRLMFVRPTTRVFGLDIVIIVFVGLTLISSIFSYEPDTSLRKMVPVSLVTIAYLFADHINSREGVVRVVTLLLMGGAVASIFAVGVQLVGKDLKVLRLAEESPLRQAGVAEGYTILSANGVRVSTPEDLLAAIRDHSKDGIAAITVYRHELVDTYKLPADYGSGDVAGLGILEWSRGHDTRATGFYGHYVTFAEVLQLIASLALGILITMSKRRWLLCIVLALYGTALFLTITRASWLAFGISAGLMILIQASRRTILISIAVMIPLAIGGLWYLQQKRQVGFFDTSDESTSWRLRTWREGISLLINSPRHLAVGIGMDSIKKHYLEWHLFDDGRQPVGHMHSDYLQIALERGVPALLMWSAWMVIYLTLLWRGLRQKYEDPLLRGVLLGCFGGAIGFLVSGLVQFNWGDSEVVMVFYLLMGLSLAVIRSQGFSTAEAAG
jgi:hypothetical protein